MKEKIAFIHYPHGPKGARLETMPFAFNTVLALAQAGWPIDLYVWEKPLWGKLISNYSELLPAKVSTHYFTETRLNPINPWRHLWYRFLFQFLRSYRCVFGVGQVGAYIGNLVASASGCPLIQIVDEFPSNWSQSRWSALEQVAARDATMLVIPDEQQFQWLSQELNVPLSKPYAVLPNVAVVDHLTKAINWHARLGLPEHSVPFLYAGSVTPWARVPELLATVPDWPEPSVLVVHSRSEREIEAFRKQYAHLDVEHRVFWSSAPLPQDELNSLVSYCEGNFALYYNTGPHIEYIGFSSGKLMRSLVCGSPVIASNLLSFTFVTEHQLGVLVKEPAEIPNAVKQIMGHRQEYQKRCLNFCQTHASFETHWPKFCKTVMKVTGINLCKSQSE